MRRMTGQEAKNLENGEQRYGFSTRDPNDGRIKPFFEDEHGGKFTDEFLNSFGDKTFFRLIKGRVIRSVVGEDWKNVLTEPAGNSRSPYFLINEMHPNYTPLQVDENTDFYLNAESLAWRRDYLRHEEIAKQVPVAAQAATPLDTDSATGRLPDTGHTARLTTGNGKGWASGRTTY